MTDRATRPRTTRERRSPTPGAVRTRAAIHRLKGALAEGRFVLHHQPIVSARDSQVAGVEALLRWRRPQEEKEDLTELLWAAERSSVIFKLENWALAQAFQAAHEWREAGLIGVRLNVNLSAREFPRAHLVKRLERHLAAAGVDPAGVGLEITETNRLREFSAVAEQLQALRAMGVELWLDDFGTGHSSLEWLSHLPCHGVKIPGTFLDRLFTERRCQAIVRRVIDLAHDLGLRVIAEGIETSAQRDFLAEHGCDLFQGFLLYAPMPAGELPLALGGAGRGGP
jgi:EAL domain-containing protein (putative c-di-GMP-specific phosphodiesterase class I)